MKAVDNALGSCQDGQPECRAFPASGQMTSYGPGSDGDVQAGAARSFTDNGDGTITDNATGLMWEKKSDDGSIHDWNNVHTWCKATSPFDGVDGVCDTVGDPMDGTMVTTFLAALNAGSGFAGHTDWRIPNINELQSLVNYEIALPGPTVYSAFNTGCAPGCTVTTCNCTQSGTYWSSTTYQYAPGYAWYVFFAAGYVDRFSKSSGNYVRAVRGGL